MTENASRSQIVHRWYTRPVSFVTDVNRAARFYVEMLGFEKVGTKRTVQERFAG